MLKDCCPIRLIYQHLQSFGKNQSLNFYTVTMQWYSFYWPTLYIERQFMRQQQRVQPKPVAL